MFSRHRSPNLSIKRRLWVALALLVSIGSVSAATVNFPNVPLYLISGVAPNVMMMIDDSGSMISIMWDSGTTSNPGYNPSTTYPDWSGTSTFGVFTPLWDPTSSQVYINSVPSAYLGFGTCTGNAKLGISSTGKVKCLILPDPVASNPPPPPPPPYTTVAAAQKHTLYAGNYLNYLFSTYGTAVNAGPLAAPNPVTPVWKDPNYTPDYRINVAKTVVKNLVSDPANSNIRFCLSTLNFGPGFSGIKPNHGGRIIQGCGLLPAGSAALDQYNDNVDALSAYTNTPLAETMYEISRYFRGLPPFYNSSDYNYPFNTTNNPTPNYNQPRCQRNDVIFVTDGFPTQDTTFPTSANQEPNYFNTDKNYLESNGTQPFLPNYDGIASPMKQSQFPGNIPPYADGFQPSGNASQEGYTLYLDDLALFGHELNITVPGVDPAKQPYNDPAFSPRNLTTFTVGLSTGNQMLLDAATYGGGQYFASYSEAQLQTSLQAALSTVQAQAASSASVAATSGSLSTSTLLFQATYQSGSWTGDLLAFAYATGDKTSVCGTSAVIGTTCPAWSPNSAAVTNDAAYHSAAGSNNRNVITYNPTTHAGVPFKKIGDLSAAQQTILNTNPDVALNAPTPPPPPSQDALGPARIAYLRGDPTNEAPAGPFRSRTFKNSAGVNQTYLLGDIIDSNPFYVGPPSFDYGFDNYAKFHNSNQTRTPMVYAGGNDGMLHAFQGDVAGKGKELFAYIPSPVFGTLSPNGAITPQLTKLTSPTYTHSYMVDGPVTSNDAYVSGNWKTVLVGGLGIGGRGIYALDVTNPTSFTASNVMWEFTSADDPDLGYTLGQPAIVRINDGTADGRWAAVVSSGYNNNETTGQSAIFILFLDHKAGSSWNKGTDYSASTDYVEIKLKTSAATAANPNGLATPAVIDANNDGFVDAIYVGDLYGDLWKIDISQSTPPTTAAFGGVPLFVALDPSGNRQAITERPQVGYNLLTPNAPLNVVVYFGTGRYLDSTDLTTTQQQTFYGIFDNYAWAQNAGTLPTITRSNLQKQTITESGSLRTVSSSPIPAQDYGFFMDLYDPKERQITNPVLIDGRILYTTLIPSNSDPCVSSTSGWLMEIDARTGGQLAQQPLFTEINGVSNSASASGVLSTNGALGTPSVVDLGNGTARVVANGSDGKQFQLLQNSSSLVGRQTWYEFTP